MILIKILFFISMFYQHLMTTKLKLIFLLSLSMSINLFHCLFYILMHILDFQRLNYFSMPFSTLYCPILILKSFSTSYCLSLNSMPLSTSYCPNFFITVYSQKFMDLLSKYFLNFLLMPLNIKLFISFSMTINLQLFITFNINASISINVHSYFLMTILLH